MRRTAVITAKDEGKKVRLVFTFDSKTYHYTRDEVENRFQKFLDDLHEVMKSRFYVTDIRVK